LRNSGAAVCVGFLFPGPRETCLFSLLQAEVPPLPCDPSIVEPKFFLPPPCFGCVLLLWFPAFLHQPFFYFFGRRVFPSFFFSLDTLKLTSIACAPFPCFSKRVSPPLQGVFPCFWRLQSPCSDTNPSPPQNGPWENARSPGTMIFFLKVGHFAAFLSFRCPPVLLA